MPAEEGPKRKQGLGPSATPGPGQAPGAGGLVSHAEALEECPTGTHTSDLGLETRLERWDDENGAGSAIGD